MKNEGFNASNDSLNKGVDLAGAGQEDKKKKSKTWSVVVKQAASLQMSEFSSGRYRTVLSDVHEAVREGTIDVVDQAIARAKKAKNLNDLDDMGLSGLHHAVRYNRYEAVAKLLDHGAQVNIRSRDESNTPLHISSRFGWRETTKLLLDHGANPNAKNNNGSTPLHLACRRGNKQLVSLLLETHSIEVNAVDKSLLTPLHVAGINGDAELCKMLLDKGADYMAQAVDKTTPLHVAVANGNRIASKVILDQAIAMSANMADIINARDIDSNTILHLAALTNNKEIAEEILKHINLPSVNLTKTNFATPLHLACTKGHLEMVKLFVSKGADIHYSRTFDGRTALHKAASFGHLDIINFLLDEGANVDARDYINRTPFLEAVASGQSGSAVLLLSRGAKITAYDNQVKNCLHLAIENENQDTLMVLLDTDDCLENLYSPDVRERVPLHYAAVCSNIRVLQVLLKKQTRFAFQDENQQTPIYLAAEAGGADHVEALGRAGSSISDRDDEGRSAMHVAAAKGHRKVCEKLIKLGADVNCRDNLRSTPLMAAARNGGIKTCEALLENEAKIDAINSSEDTALLEAVRYNHVAVVELLLDCGASVTIRNDTNLGLIDTAVKYGSSEVVMAICQHQRWKEVLSDKTCPNGQPPMKLLIAHFPDAAKLIMDKCVQPAEHMSPSHLDYTITYDFQLLDPGPDDPAAIHGNRYFGPETMVQNNQANLLLHPLTQVLLQKKWSVLGKTVFYLSFFLFLAFTTIYTAFLVDERRIATFRSLSATNTSKASSLFQHSNLGVSVPFVILVFAVIQMAKEVFQIFFQGKVYFTQATNGLEWALYSTVVVFMIPYVAPDEWVDTNYGKFSDPYIMWIVAVISIFLCYVNFVLFLRRFATLGLYITMHMEVMRTVVKVMVVFIIFVFAFSVVFYILFKEQDAFQTLGHAFVKVTIMMVGEIEYDDTFINTINTFNTKTKNPMNPFPEAAFVFIFIFVFIMGISLMNLLVGLAVGDIDKIQREATLKRQAMQVEFVSQIEDKYPRFISRMVYTQVLVVRPNQSSLMTRMKRRIFGTKDSSSEEYGSYSESYDSTKELGKKIDKTKKRVKYLVAAMDAQSRLLKALARKIDPSLNIESLYQDDWITPEMMPDNDGDQEEFNLAVLDEPEEKKEVDPMPSSVEVASL